MFKKNLNISSLEPIPTGNIFFDTITGGIPKGRITHLFAPDGVGKTTLALYLISNMMYNDLKNNKEPYFFYLDCEQSYNEEWFKKLFYPLQVNIIDEESYFLIMDSNNQEIGVIVQPLYYEDIKNIFSYIIEYIVKNQKQGYLLWDSVVKPITRKFEKDNETLAYKSQNIQDIIDAYQKAIADSGLTCIFINQIRDKFATNFFAQDIKGETIDFDKHVPGGWALKFASSLSIGILRGREFEYGGTVEERKNPFYISGRVLKIKTGKNRIRSKTQGLMIFIDNFGYSQIINALILLDYKEKGSLLGNIKGEIINHEKDIRFDTFIKDIDNYLENLFRNAVKKAINNTKFTLEENIKFIKENLPFYYDLFSKEAEILYNHCKESAGVKVDDEINLDDLFDNKNLQKSNEETLPDEI